MTGREGHFIATVMTRHDQRHEESIVTSSDIS